jgi:hypothetical protein
MPNLTMNLSLKVLYFILKILCVMFLDKDKNIHEC